MVRNKSEVWNYFEIDGNKTTCKFCRKEAFKNPSRMPVHLTKCRNCPDSVKEKMINITANLPSKTVQINRQSPDSRVALSSQKQLSPSYMEQSELDDIADIEVVNEEDIETSEVFLSDGKFKLINSGFSEHWNRKNGDADRNLFKKVDTEKITDQFSLFGDCVAHKLRSINNPRAQAIAQYYINSVLFRAEMTNFDDEFSFVSPQEFKLFDKINKHEETTSS